LLVEFGVPGVDANDEEGFVWAYVVEGVEGYAAGSGFCDSEEFGFAFVEVGRSVDKRSGGLGESR
jgi:hypothetical protein